tara:strand:+ start:3589 stop:4404 length:816 start_codon:yes stop_codon:yes gene_type:complete
MLNITNSNISVVIPSLGGKILIETIKSINSGSVFPDEIIIVIPKEFKSNSIEIKAKNVKFLFTEHKGQVYQRCEGFKIAKHKYVLQLDDDVFLDKDCLRSLVKNIKKNTSIAPIMCYKKSKKSVFYYSNNWFLNFLHWFIHGYKFGSKKMGTVSKSVLAFGHDNIVYENPIVSSEWLAGGCILHNKENLILKNYFPFPGKAYGEDLIHSFFLKQNNISLLLNKNAICFIDEFDSSLYNLEMDYNSKKYYNKLNKRNNFRLNLWYFYKKLFS